MYDTLRKLYIYIGQSIIRIQSLKKRLAVSVDDDSGYTVNPMIRNPHSRAERKGEGEGLCSAPCGRPRDTVRGALFGAPW